MANENERFALVGYALATELMKRQQAGQTAWALELERSVRALIAAKPPIGFRQFISEMKPKTG